MRRPQSSRAIAFATFTGLGAFAIAQPVLDLVGGAPELLVAHGVRGGTLVALALALTAVPGLALGTVATIAGGLGRRVGRAVRAGLATALVGAIAAQALRAVPLPGPLILGLAATLAGAAVAAATRLAHRRPELLPLALVLLAGLIVFPLHFLFASPARVLLRESTAAVEPLRRANPISVVLVVLDELPLVSLLDAAGELDAVRYPGFARLAAVSRWYREATTVSCWTHVAVPALLTGRYPRDRRPPVAASYPESLFTMLAGSHRLQVDETMTELCPATLCGPRAAPPLDRQGWQRLGADLAVVWLHRTLPVDLARRLPPIDQAWSGFGRQPAERVEPPPRKRGRRARRRPPSGPQARLDRLLVDAGEDAPRPALHYLHLPVPHVPWRYYPSGREYVAPAGQAIDGLDGDRWVGAPALVAHAWQRHLLQVGFADFLIGRLVDGLERSGRLDEVLLIVTADHGTAFAPGGQRRAVTPENQAEVLQVPLFVKLPGERRPRVDRRVAELIDVVPTIVDGLGGVSPWPLDGASLIAPRAAPRRDRQVAADRRLLHFPPRLDLAPALARKAALFGEGDPRRLYAPARFAGWLGAAVAAVPTSSGPTVRVELEDPRPGRRVARGAPLPGRVSGKIETSGPPPLAIALAVDGVVRALAEPYRHPDIDGWDGWRFTTLLPETALRRGAHEVEALVLAAGTPSRLRRTTGSPTTPARRHRSPLAVAHPSSSAARRARPSAPGSAVTGSRRDLR